MQEIKYPWGTDRPYYSYSDWCKNEFGGRLQKVSLHAGFTCPNRDGSKGHTGCTFCNNKGFSPSYCHDELSIGEQLDKGLEFLKKRYKRANLYIAYFQAYSNTYSDIVHLERTYREALSHPEIMGISIGTRPDCIDEEKLLLLKELSRKHFVSVEYGVESCYDATLARVNRGHDFACSQKAVSMTAAHGLHTGIHMILGLPGETRSMMLDQAQILSKMPINTLKIHQLQIVKDTPMALEYASHPEHFHFFEPDEWVDFVIRFLEHLRPDIALERLAGEVPPTYNLRKSWGMLRSDAVNVMIEKKMKELRTRQGRLYDSIC